MHMLAPVFKMADNDEDATITVRLRANRREIKTATRKWSTRMDLIRDLVDGGYLQPAGCDCTHCRNDWDCCGRLIVSYAKIKRVRRGLVVTQHLSRNI